MRRHDLAYIRAGSSFNFLCGAGSKELVAAVSAWIAVGHPLVVCRQWNDSEQVQLALTLPTSQGRQRVAARFKHEDLIRVSPAVEIRHCLAGLDTHAAQVLSELNSLLQKCGASVGVFGSLAWESITGESYRHAASDVDLICDVASHLQLDACLNALEEAASKLAFRLDGELRFPNGEAVAWRELANHCNSPQAKILVKGPVDVSLKPVSSLTEMLIEEPANA